MKSVAFLFLVLTSSITFSQSDAFSNDVKQCLKSNGTHAYYENVVNQMFVMLKQQYESQNVPQSVWADIELIKPEALNSLTEMIVSAYKGHYTHEDVIQMNKLYATDTGKRMTTNSNSLTEADKIVIKAFYASKTGEKILGSQNSMNAVLTSITEKWSGELYQNVVEQLSEKGFNKS